MRSIAGIVIAVILVAACGDKDSPNITMDAGDTGVAAEVVDHKAECTPQCEGKECGYDGCGGTCGECQMQIETCSEDGQCVAATCKSTKDCPGDLVCDKDAGHCVACLADEDCPAGKKCGADHDCHSEHQCVADKDCKELDMVCDKVAGICVECLGAEDCADGEFCKDGFCLPPACAAAESKCEDNAVVTCADDGSAWETVTACEATQYCEDSECKDYVCTPDDTWCDGDVAKTCSDDGKSVKSEKDCAETGWHCFEGECTETVCQPDSKFCISNITWGQCAGDGMDFVKDECPAETYCDLGECKPWVCEPGTAFCDLNTAKICNPKGSGILNETDCGDNVCIDGQCLALVCPPGQFFCIEPTSVGKCADDGLSHEFVEVCVGQESCHNGACKPWICSPGDPMCDGSTATVCDDLGMGPVAGGADCAGQGQFCLGGECVACEPQCDGKACGDNGCGGECGQCPDNVLCQQGQCTGCDDGNDVDWDGCTDGEITEFQINSHTTNDQGTPSVAPLTDGGVVVVWESQQDAVGYGVFAQRYAAAGIPNGPEFQVNSFETGGQRNPDVAGLPDGRFFVVWHSSGQDDDKQGVVGALFDPSGSAEGPEFLINDYEMGPQIAAATDFTDEGMGAIVWAGEGAGDSQGIYLRMMDSEGGLVGQQSLVNSTIDGHQSSPAVACLDSGDILVVWGSLDGPVGKEIRGQRLGPTGAKVGGEFVVNDNSEGDQDMPFVAGLTGGGFTVVWESHSPAEQPNQEGVFARHFAPDGSKLGAELKLSSSKIDIVAAPAVVQGTSGAVVFVWSGAVPTDEIGKNDLGILGAVTPPDGSTVSEQFHVSTNKTSSYSKKYPAICSLGDGLLLSVWHANKLDGSGQGIFGQTITEKGSKMSWP